MSLLPVQRWFEMGNVFDDFFSSQSKLSDNDFFSPRVDVTEKEDHYEIVADLPGVKKDDVNVQLHDGLLTIEAKMKEERTSEKDKVIRKERRSGTFMRSFNVGNAVNESDITAKFDNGVLTLHAPKVPQVQEQRRRININ